MPVQDFNMVEALKNFTNVISSTETTTEFWKDNASFVSLFLVFIILMVCAFAILIMLVFLFKKAKSYV